MIEFLREHLAGLPPLLVCLAVGLLLVAEAALVVGVVLPGASALLVFGFLTNLGAVPLVPAMLTAGLAALLGSQLAYWRGRKLGGDGGDLPRSWTVRRLGPHRWQRVVNLVDRHGERAVPLGQWVVGARTLVPRLSGMAGLPYRRFARWNIPISPVWGALWVLVGWFAGRSYELVATVSSWVSLGLLGVLLVVAAILFWRKRTAPESRTRRMPQEQRATQGPRSSSTLDLPCAATARAEPGENRTNPETAKSELGSTSTSST
ncbi:membrane protein DedA with SNARE-associated domain [Crossiella equi]|uniref:Membrane protein DedA with SNARE-associated domain n=1 Tax=Crossiella equi TaxID=130796 RepID=A0ABS5AAL8_9PSEU|nr:DedA family protein [Crossiella equi]MBP2473621.1 membrane protein DedA with SNARE-associated domain [Crossiella equi]